MKLSDLFSLGMTLAGGVAAGRLLRRRHAWEQAQRTMHICIDYDDAVDAAIRSALPFGEMLQRLVESGATHMSLPELTLDRLLHQGLLAPQAPAAPLREPAPLGHWNYLHGPAALLTHLAGELCHRMPHTEARVLQETTLAFAGNLPALRTVGLGFDDDRAAQIKGQGLAVVPRPVSYDWPDPALLARTLAQAALLGELVAFDGEMILGHEMHLDATVAALEEHNLTFVYFAHSRHQKGDWFVAKRRAPRIVLGHRLTAEDMVPLDYHAAAHNWAHLAREQGIRFCYLNFFRVLHATEPLEGLHYVSHVREALLEAGFEVAGDRNECVMAPRSEAADLALTALAPAGIGAVAAKRTLGLSEAAALPLTAVAAAGAVALPLVEQRWVQRVASMPHEHHHEHNGQHHAHDGDHEHLHHTHVHDEHDDHAHQAHSHMSADLSLEASYPPSYSPKLLALATAALAPLSVMTADEMNGLWRTISPVMAAATLAALTADGQYMLRIEAYRSYGLDWLVPLAGAASRIADARMRLVSLAALGAVWLAARQSGDPDLLAKVDAAHSMGHTHHISAAARLAGDLGIWLGPRPARKWAAVAPLALAAHEALLQRGRIREATLANLTATLAYTLGLSAFRQPQRNLELTVSGTAPGYTLGTALGALFEGRIS